MPRDVLILILVLAAALGWMAWKSRDSRRWMFVLACLLVAGSYWMAVKWEQNLHSKKRSSVQLSEKMPQVGHPGGYVSSDACQSCHSDQYESWHQSFHRTMTQVASPETVLGDFNHVTLQVDGETFQLEQRGEEYWVEMVDPNWKNDQAKARAGMAGYRVQDPSKAPRVWKRIGMLTGSHHFQAYWVPSLFGNAQFAFPFAWLIPEKRWVPRKDTFIRDPDAPSPSQVWNMNCIQCHVTGGQPGHHPTTKITHSIVGELSIGCESCHGPGETHVTANQDPLHRYLAHFSTKPDKTIVHPKHLSTKQQTQVCGQCHGMKWMIDYTGWTQAGAKYRPGDDLETTAPLIRPAHFEEQPWLPEGFKKDHDFLSGAFWADGRIRVTGREYNGLVETACHTNGPMTCLSCHSIHQSKPVNQVAQGMDGNQACLQCHPKIGANLTAHTHHGVNSSGSQCYNCHMPYATYGLLKAVRNHYIDSPDVKTTLTTGRPNACNLCHLDQSLGWSAKHLNTWYGTPVPDLPLEEQTTSSAVLMMLRGDAGQRGLLAANAGWAPAREVSGDRWLAYYLCGMLDDPYSAVRLMAHRSLRTISGFESVEFDYVAAPAVRAQARAKALQRWKQLGADRTGAAVLFRTNGQPDFETIERYLSQRDQRIVDLIE